MTSIESTKVVKREIEIEVKELSGCNLESLSFAELLYNGLIKLVVSKIDSGALGQPAPQIGPLMMEVKQLKNEFLNQTMNDDAIEKMRTALIRGARTLVKAGDVQPKDLSFLPCNLTDQEGYLIFPLSTLNEARSEDFNQWKLSPRLTHENGTLHKACKRSHSIFSFHSFQILYWIPLQSQPCCQSYILVPPRPWPTQSLICRSKRVKIS